MFMRPIVETHQLLQPSINFFAPSSTLRPESRWLTRLKREPSNSDSVTVTSGRSCPMSWRIPRSLPRSITPKKESASPARRPISPPAFFRLTGRSPVAPEAWESSSRKSAAHASTWSGRDPYLVGRDFSRKGSRVSKRLQAFFKNLTKEADNSYSRFHVHAPETLAISAKSRWKPMIVWPDLTPSSPEIWLSASFSTAASTHRRHPACDCSMG